MELGNRLLMKTLQILKIILFYRRNSMSWYTMLWDIFIICLGIMFGIVGMYYSGKALFRAYDLGIPV